MIFIFAGLSIAGCKKSESPSDNHTSQMVGNHLWTGIYITESTVGSTVLMGPDTVNRTFPDSIMVFSSTKIGFSSDWAYSEYDTLLFSSNTSNTVTFTGSIGTDRYFFVKEVLTYDFFSNQYSRQYASGYVMVSNNKGENYQGFYTSP